MGKSDSKPLGLLIILLAAVVFAGCAASAEDAAVVPARNDNESAGEHRRKAVLLVGSRPVIECEQIGESCVFDGDIGLAESQLASLDVRHDRTDESDIGDDSERENLGQSRSALLSSSGSSFKWPNGIVPYTIDPNLSWTIRDKVAEAISHWQTRTPIRFVPRTSESGYVAFVPSGVSYAWADIGRQGGRQTVNLVERNPVGVIVHETGHTLGFWHEHTRPDRDTYVTVHWGNIRAGLEGNFYTFSSGTMVGGYDIDSIMHYPSYEFSANGYATITRKNGTTYPSNYTALSAGDIAAVQQIYGSSVPGELVVDSNNGRNDTSKGYVEVSSNWTSSTLKAGYYGTGYWAGKTTAGASDSATFYFYLATASTKTIDAWWTSDTNRASAAPWVMRSADGTQLATATVDQRANGGKWNTLATATFPAGWNRIELGRATGANDSYVIADAVRIR